MQTRLEFRRRWRERGGKPPPDVRTVAQQILDENRLRGLAQRKFLSDHLLSHEQVQFTEIASSWEVDVPPEVVPRIVYERIEDTPLYQANIARHDSLRAAVAARVHSARRRAAVYHAQVLVDYQQLLEQWKAQQQAPKKRPDARAADKRKKKARPASASVARSSSPAVDPIEASASLDVLRPSRRTARSAMSGDAARSEEHYEMILARLQYEDESNPEVRFLKTMSPVPDMLTEEQKRVRYTNQSGRVDDPVFEEYQRRFHMNPWRSRERKVFVDKFRQFGKNFRKIASFLPHKDVFDCVQLYYLEKHTLELVQKRTMPPPALHSLQQQQQLARRSGKTPLKSHASPLPLAPSTPTAPSTSLTTFAGAPDFSQLAAIPELDSGELSVQPSKPRRAVDRLVRIAPKRPRSAGPADDAEQFGLVDSLSSSLLPGSPGTPMRDLELSGGGGSPKGSPSSRNRRRQRLEQNQTPATSLSSASLLSRAAQPAEPRPLSTHWTDAERELYRDAITCYGRDFKQVAMYVASKNQFECREFYFQFQRRLLGRRSATDAAHNVAAPPTPANDDGSSPAHGDSASSSSSSTSTSPLPLQQPAQSIWNSSESAVPCGILNQAPPPLCAILLETLYRQTPQVL